MPDVASTALVATGGALFVAGLATQVATHRLRRRWTQLGMGLEERSTGLASLTAIPALFPAELEAAQATDTQLAVIAMRRYTEQPDTFGRRLQEATRAHETAWRIDYDLFAVTVSVADRDEAVLAAARLGRASSEGPVEELRVGVAMCPDDATDMFDALDVALRRMRGFAVHDAVAQQLQRLTRAASQGEDQELQAQAV